VSALLLLSTLSLHDALPSSGLRLIDLGEVLGECRQVLVAQTLGQPVHDRGACGRGIRLEGLQLSEQYAFRASGNAGDAAGRATRSEEHTSELQSRENVVCRL